MSRRDGKYWDESWNPIVVAAPGGAGTTARPAYHCTKCSPGCLNCWAEKINIIAGGKPYSEASGAPAEFVFSENSLVKIAHKKPKTFFVCDLCDLFHPGVPYPVIDRVFEAIEKQKQHKFLVLTKRPDIMYDYFYKHYWAMTHIFFGVSVCVESEKWKIDTLRAVHKWVSFGPLLGQMDKVDLAGIDWVVMEAESLGGRPGRECNWAWMLSIINQAKDQGVPVWVKQINYRNRLIKNIEELPAALRVRELPKEWE